MSEKPKSCPSCGGTDLYLTTTQARGTFGPDLLPGVGSTFTGAKMDIVACSECGHLSFFAAKPYWNEIRNSKKWKKVE